MSQEIKYVRSIVSIKELKQGMIILAYTGFSQKHQNMVEETCKFIKHNFRSCTTIIIRNGKEIEIPIEQIQPGDTLNRIHKIPTELKKLTIANEKLAKALGNRGFTKFEVKKPKKVEKPQVPVSKSPSSAAVTQENKDKANKFVQQLTENVKTHSDTSKAIENIMDDARKGKVSYGSIKSYVDDITASSSSAAMSAIVSLKESNQTYDHCVDVGVIFQSCYYRIMEIKGETGIFSDKSQAILAAFLHDFGKSKIPKDILDSTVRFERDSQEMKMLQSHPDFAVELLQGMKMDDNVINMARYHHVKQNTTMNSCYPKGISYEEVIYETRLLAIIDVYQALVGRRKYKKSWNPPAAMRYLDALAGVEFDEDIWEDFLIVMGMYPKGSLIELNDGSLGFVMNVSEEDPERPQIVLVRDAAGEDLTQHSLIDLVSETDIEIVKDIDVLEVFGKDAMEIFSNINIS